MAIGCPYDVFMNSTPYEIKAFDKAHKMKRIIADENNWYLGQYVLSAQQVVISRAFSKKSEAEYVKEPFMYKFLNDDDMSENVGESNEMLAAAEFMQFANILKREGMPETKI